MTVFFISDTHFGHSNIINFEKHYRGMFQTSEEMDEHMVKQWNSVVTERDTVWHLGDVIFRGTSNILNRLNGSKFLVMGNHDEESMYPEGCFQGFYGMKKIGHYYLTHCPMHSFEIDEYKGYKNVHGHIHSRLVLTKGLKPDTRYINVGVELCDFKPVALEELEKYQENLFKDKLKVQRAIDKAKADIERCNIKNV